MIYLISYDLKHQSGRNYEQLFSSIKTLGNWWHYLDSTWLVQTQGYYFNWQSNQLANYLRNSIDVDDNLFIAKIDTAEMPSGWLPREAWDWIRDHS